MMSNMTRSIQPNASKKKKIGNKHSEDDCCKSQKPLNDTDSKLEKSQKNKLEFITKGFDKIVR